MPTKKLVRDSKSESSKKIKSERPTEVPEGAVQVTHGNAPLLTVKYCELILTELRKITAKLDG